MTGAVFAVTSDCSSVDDVQLAGDGLSAGAAFELDRPAEVDVAIEFEHGWSMKMNAGHATCVVRGCDLKGYRPVLGSAWAAASRGLDLLHMNDRTAYAITNAANEHIVFWPQNGALQIHWAAILCMTFSFRATGRVFRPDGTEVVASRTPWRHHPSFAHFRRSELEKDLSDSFRHAYLALESLLDDIYPQQAAMKEGEWIESALQAAHSIAPLPSTSQLPQESPVARAMRRWYAEERLHLFHSKQSRTGSVPDRTVLDHEGLIEKRHELVRYYANLVHGHLNVVVGESRLSDAAFSGVVDRLESMAEVLHALDDAEPEMNGAASSVKRSWVSGSPSTEAIFQCRAVEVPKSRRVKTRR
jgi:hypothetical protein